MFFEKRLFMRSEENLPPENKILKIANNLVKIYIFIWKNKNESNILKLKWEEVIPFFNKNTFRTALRKISQENLIFYKETKDGVAISCIL